ncbi:MULTISPECIES: ABC transporter substrate-binding protein [Halorussus]|uniref:ABC transporter substrate-binding protein n=1 Tax=Halorussus TaxID=1070314 RepID=UPI00209F3558|nr:extracellular solute-binding protein [Halorussus vallis]USZ74575.1 extracellular solute-binding protein [Halorussus vallis]
MKLAGGVSAGALGALAGCAGQSNDGKKTDGEGNANSKDDTAANKDGGQQESVTVSYWSGKAAETPQLKQYFQKGMKTFEKQNSKVKVDLSVMSWDQLNQKYITTMQSGTNPPDLAAAGTYGLEMFQNGKVAELSTFMEGDSDLPEKWTPAMQEATDYRGKQWAAGIGGLNTTVFALRSDIFRNAAGIQNPEKELKTWTQMRRALDKIKKNTDAHAYEVTGTQADVEPYWGNARTAYTGGTDPWIDVEDKGSSKDPHVKPGKAARTDGMIKNNIDLGKAYSTDKHPSRGDEGVIPLFVRGDIASYGYSLSVKSIKAINPDATFGWDGEAYALAAPKLDPNYGNEFDIPELADKKGQHGGHSWTLEGQLCLTKSSKVKDAAFKLAKFRNTSKDFGLPLYVDPKLAQSVPAYKPLLEAIQQSKYEKMRTQPLNKQISLLENYGDNYRTTGAKWDIPSTSTIRWDNIGGTMAKAYAGQIKRDKAPQQMGKAIEKTIQSAG